MKKVLLIGICIFMLSGCTSTAFIEPDDGGGTNVPDDETTFATVYDYTTAIYNDAVLLMEAGKYQEAISVFKALDGYMDSEDKICECRTAIWDKIQKINIGDTYTLGSYEQDNNISNGKEKIEWLVIAREGTEILVISKYALDCQQYNTSYTDVTWETCTLRQWLNNDFLNSAFSDAEETIISTATVSADRNFAYKTDAGNNSQDKVFLLSITEVNKYLKYGCCVAECKVTAYAEAQGARVDDCGSCVWWLRSPGWDQHYAALGYYDTTTSKWASPYDGNPVHTTDICIRPALWIDLSKI